MTFKPDAKQRPTKPPNGRRRTHGGKPAAGQKEGPSISTDRRAVWMTILAAVSSGAFARPAVAQRQLRCALKPGQVPSRPEFLKGSVVRAVPPEQVRIATEHVEKESGARISPDYADLPRILAQVTNGGRTFQTLASVVDGRMLQPGDPVQLLSRYRDPRLPCHFIPWTIGAPNAVF